MRLHLKTQMGIRPVQLFWKPTDVINPHEIKRIARELKCFVSEAGFVRQRDENTFDQKNYSSEREVDFCGQYELMENIFCRNLVCIASFYTLLRDPFVSISRTEYFCFRPGWPDDLQAHGQLIRRKPAGDGNGRKAGEIKRGGEPSQQGRLFHGIRTDNVGR